MSSLLEKLPTMLMLGVLLGIFFSLRKHTKSRTINLWIIAWGLILAHFVAQAFEALPGWREQLSGIIDLAGLELSGLVLIASGVFEDDGQQQAVDLAVRLRVEVSSIGL